MQDAFETPTTELAHVVLPAAMAGEKEGIADEQRASRSRASRAAVPPPGEARSGFDIVLAIAAR